MKNLWSKSITFALLYLEQDFFRQFYFLFLYLKLFIKFVYLIFISMFFFLNLSRIDVNTIIVLQLRKNTYLWIDFFWIHCFLKQD